jgi:hypothetical protein
LNAYMEKGLLLHYDAPATVATTLLVGLVALLLGSVAFGGVPWVRGPSFMIVATASIAATLTATRMAANWRVWGDAGFNTLSPSDHLHPVVALATYPWYFVPAVAVELLLCIAFAVAVYRANRTNQPAAN